MNFAELAPSQLIHGEICGVRIHFHLDVRVPNVTSHERVSDWSLRVLFKEESQLLRGHR
jgi:hypothetical protein